MCVCQILNSNMFNVNHAIQYCTKVNHGNT